MDGDLQPLLQLQQHRCWLAARAILSALRPAGAMAAAFEGGDEDGDGGP